MFFDDVQLLVRNILKIPTVHAVRNDANEQWRFAYENSSILSIEFEAGTNHDLYVGNANFESELKDAQKEALAVAIKVCRVLSVQPKFKGVTKSVKRVMRKFYNKEAEFQDDFLYGLRQSVETEYGAERVYALMNARCSVGIVNMIYYLKHDSHCGSYFYLEFVNGNV